MEKNTEKKWNNLDKIIAKFRYTEVDKWVEEDSKIVDFGCGQEGKFLLRHQSKINEGYGFDYKIEDRKINNITFINNKSSQDIMLEKNSVDTVFFNAVLEHLESPREVMLNTLDILKSGGKIVMTTPTPSSKPILEFLAYKLHIINEAEIREHVHYYSKKDIEDLITYLNQYHDVKLCEYKNFELGLNSLIVIEKK